MLKLSKILCSTIVITGMVVATGMAYGQARSSVKEKKSQLTVGFQCGREMLFHSSPLLHNKQSKAHYAVSRNLVLRKPINNHINLQTGIRYSTVEKSINNKEALERENLNRLTIPVTGEYHFLSSRARFRPYLGGGVLYNFSNKLNTYPSFSNQIYNTPASIQDTKYISVIMTQGIIFEVNTKIQITQSFHFIPGNKAKTMGIDIGIGFKL